MYIWAFYCPLDCVYTFCTFSNLKKKIKFFMKKHKIASKSKISQTSTVVGTAATRSSSAFKETYAGDGNRPVRVYCERIFVLIYFGHARHLKQAKKLFPRARLLVGVCNGALTCSPKRKNVMSYVERYEILRHCKWIDDLLKMRHVLFLKDF